MNRILNRYQWKNGSTIGFWVALLLVIFFISILPFEDPAYLLVGVGGFLSVTAFFLRDEAGAGRFLPDPHPLADEITRAMAQIKEPAFRKKADRLLFTVRENLSLLQQGVLPLDETEFYREATAGLDRTERQVKAVDPLTADWEGVGPLHHYYSANLRALRYGVMITRIFVLPRRRLAEAGIQKVLLAQFHAGIDVRIAFQEALPSLAEEGGPESFDFAVYDDRQVLDRTGAPDGSFGRETRIASQVGKYLRLFDSIERHASPALLEDGAIVPADAARSLFPQDDRERIGPVS